MIGVDELNERWERHIADHRVMTQMAFIDGFLMLGTGTHLAKVGAPLDQPGLAARLAAAHGRSVAASSLAHIQHALEKNRDGDQVLALIHLALSGLAKLRNPLADARRLFLADALITDGVDPEVIAKGLGLDLPSSDEALDKYGPDQPRVPPGNPDGGQWTNGDWAEAPNSPTPSKAPSRQNGSPSARATDASHPANGASAQESRHNDLPIADAAYQGNYHDFLRDHFAEALDKARNTVLKEVPIILPADVPITAKIDILARTPTGEVFGIEVKTGDDPTFTDAQRIVYPHVEAGDIVISNDPRMGALMFTPGVPWPHVDLFVLYTRGPGAPIEVWPILRFMQK